MEGGKIPVLPLPHDGLNETPADVLDGHQSEPDAPLLHREPVGGTVDVRRQQGDAAVLALVDIARHLVGVVQHAGQQRRHILLCKVALEVRRLVGHHRVADSVGLVESVVGEVVDFLIDGLRRGLRDAVSHAACNTSFLVTVDKGVLLLLNLGGFLLGDGPAHHVRLPQGVPAQLLEDLNDLLLVDDAAVGDGQDRLQRGMLVLDELRVLLAGDEPGDGVHGAGAVQGDDGGDVLDVLGFQAHAHAGHAGGLHLEHAGGLALGDHLKSGPVVLRDVGQPEIRVLLLDHFHRVVQHRQVPEAQEVHFQEAQLLQRRHDVLADHGLVVFCQGHVLIHRPLRDDHAGGVGGGVARHPLQRPGGVNELFYPLVGVVQVR